jgi:copper(I)-binding protein
MKEHALVRGGEHIMFMGLKEPFENGKIIPVTLLFEKAGEVNIKVVVDQKRKEKKHSQSHNH